ncbi:hypothetical protein EJ110_NYTH06699 [Nymphaea thermarum]|nr:hypothetical protein EJ110_NYTH06699 [Nymphaea thermarum]
MELDYFRMYKEGTKPNEINMISLSLAHGKEDREGKGGVALIILSNRGKLHEFYNSPRIYYVFWAFVIVGLLGLRNSSAMLKKGTSPNG